MIALIRLLLNLLATPFRSKSALEAENAALRQQIIVLRCKLRGRIRLSNGDRRFFVWLYRLFPSISRAMLIIRPDTLVRLAARGLPLLLALEVACSYWPPSGQSRTSGLDPSDER